MKLSKIASIILGGSLIIAATGCGWWDDDDNGGGSSSSVSTISGSTLAAYRTGANVIAVGDTNETFTENDGEYTFKVIKPANFTYIQVSGGINSETNTTVPYVSKALAEDYRFVSPLTTLVHDANDTMRAKLRSELGDALSIDYNDVNVTGDKLKVVKKALVVKLAVEKVLAEKGAVEVPEKIYEALEEVDLSDVNTTVAEELVTKIATKIPEVNLSDINSSIISIAKADTPDAIEGNYTKAEEAVVSSTVKLGWNRVNFGDIKVIQATPSTFVPVTIGTDKNITDFYNVSIDFNKYDVKYLPDELAANKTYEANLTITITEDWAVSSPEERSVTLKILNALITLDKNASESVTVEFKKGITKLYAVSSEDLTALYGIVGGGTYADIDDMKNYGDFEFNVNTILDKLTSNKDKINKAIEALNNYLKQDGTYDVNVSLDVNSTDLEEKLITKEITGKVIVGTGGVAKHAPKIGELDVPSYINIGSDVNINAYVKDEDGDTVTCSIEGVDWLTCSPSSVDGEGNITISGTAPNEETFETAVLKVCDSTGLCTYADLHLNITDPLAEIKKVMDKLASYYTDPIVLYAFPGEVNATEFTGVTIKNYGDEWAVVAFKNLGEDTSAGGTMYVYDDNFDKDNAFLKITYQGKYADKNVTIYYKGDEFNTTFQNGDVHLGGAE